MANDITKVYQFLGTLGDWKSKMDKNGDGTIIKYEFREFMNNDFEWDGTPTDSEKNSLIDQFWAKFDTNTKNGRISGTTYRNKNALSTDEVNTMQETIGVYENLNTYTSKLKAPAGLDSTKWKESVTASLSDITEKFIKQGGKADDLEAYLDSQIKTIEAKTTTDYYALAVSDKYKSQLDNYELYNDDTFKGFVDAYIDAKINKAADDASLPSVTEIKAEIDKIAEAYMATAEKQLNVVAETTNASVKNAEGDSTGTDETTGADNKNVLNEDPYNYEQKDTDVLNGLQKSKIKSVAKPELEAAVKKEADYNSYKDAYDTALNEFFEEALNGLKKSDYTAFLNDDTIPTSISVATFKSSVAYKNVTNTITINNTIDNLDENSDLYKQLADTYGEDFANRVKNDGKYISAMKEIKNSVIEKMKNGDYDTNGEFDTDKLIKDIVSQLGSNMSSFYANGFGDLELEDLNKVYESYVKVAELQTDTDAELKQRREAAIMYCDALASKDSYKSAVTEVFGTDYKTAIGKMLPTEINEKITKLQKLADEVVDVKDMTDAEKNALVAGIKDSYTFEQNAVDNKIQLPNSATCAGKVVTSDRITYSATGNISVDSSGKVTIDTTKIGTYSGKINILIDGNVVASKTVTVEVKNTKIAWDSMSAKYNGYIGSGDDDTPLGVKTLGELYKDNGVVSLLNTGKLEKSGNWKTSVGNAKNGVKNFVEMLSNSCMATGEYNQQALNVAKEKVIALYTAALDHSLSNWAGEKSTKNNVVDYDGEKYSYQVAKYYKNNSTTDTTYSRGCSASNNELGLRIGEQYDDHWFQIVVNAKCIMDLFSKFYEQALTA